MPLKGFSPPAQGTLPSVKVTVLNQRETTPLERNPALKEKTSALTGLLFLGGLFGAFFVLTRVRPKNQIGDLQAVGAGIGGPQPENIDMGQIVRFRIDDSNAEKVKAVTERYVDRAKKDAWLAQTTQALLNEVGIQPEDELGIAVYFHDLVNNQMGVIDDPAGFESITAPEELLNQWLVARQQGRPTLTVGGDCDDKSIVLFSLFWHAGLQSRICLFDTDGDKIFDHAAVLVMIGGDDIFAETVVPGVPLGWQPDIFAQECIAQ